MRSLQHKNDKNQGCSGASVRLVKDMDREAIAREIRVLLTHYLGLPLDSDEIGENEPLGGSRINISSLTAIEILTAIEERFEVQFPDDMIDLTLFSSIGRLVDTVNAILPDTSRKIQTRPDT